MSAFSPEEKYVRENLVANVPDVVINVVDASNIERNLYLTTQVKDMNLKVVMALNMYDELKKRGDRLDTKLLGKLLGMPVCPTVCRTGEGVPELLDTVLEVADSESSDEPVSVDKIIASEDSEEIENRYQFIHDTLSRTYLPGHILAWGVSYELDRLAGG